MGSLTVKKQQLHYILPALIAGSVERSITVSVLVVDNIRLP